MTAPSKRRTGLINHGAIAEIPAPYVAEMARSEALRIFGTEAYTGGYQVFTTIDSRLQVAANQAVSNGLEEYDQRHGFRGAEAHIDLAAIQTRERGTKHCPATARCPAWKPDW